jgi:hypothetical protein
MTPVAKEEPRDRLLEIETLIGRFHSVKRSDILWLCQEVRDSRASIEELTDRCDSLLTEVNLLRAGGEESEEEEPAPD